MKKMLIDLKKLKRTKNRTEDNKHYYINNY